MKQNRNKNSTMQKNQMPVEMPVGTLIKEINDLKQELSDIKSKKNLLITTQPENHIPKALSHFDSNSSILQTPTHDKTLEKFTIPDYEQSILQGIKHPVMEIQKKVNLILKKLSRAIRKNDTQLSYKYLSRLVEAMGRILFEQHQFGHYSQSNILKLQGNTNAFDFCQKQNRRLEEEVLDLRQELSHKIDQLEEKERELIELDGGCKVIIEKYERMFEEYENSKQVYEGLRIEKQELDEKCKIYEREIEKREEENLMMQEDVVYNRKQSEKYRLQKKQIQKMYEQILSEHRELKTAYENDVQRAQKQKDKWKYECESRRIQQSQSLQLQEQLTSLRKEINELRKQNTKYQSDISNMLSKLQEEQNKNMELQSQKYKLSIENKKLMCSVEYCKKEMKNLGIEVQQLNGDLNRYKLAYRCSEPVAKKQEKSKILSELQELIKKQKQLSEAN